MKKNIIFNVSLSLLVTIVLFIGTILFVPALLPSSALEGSMYYVTVIILQLFPLGLGIILYLILSKGKIRSLFIFSPGQFRENKSKLFLQIVIAVAMAVTGYTFVTFIQLLWLMLLDSFGYVPVAENMPAIETFSGFLLGLLSVSVIPALTEEIIFRGMLQKGLLRHKKPIAAIIITSALFMLMHGSLDTMIYTFLLGAVIGYLAYSSGSIIPSIAYHAANNAMAVGSLYLYGAFPELMNAENQAENISEFTGSDILSISVAAIISLAFIVTLLITFIAISKRPPKNPYLKPVPASSKAMLWLSAALLIGFMALIFVTSQFFSY